MFLSFAITGERLDGSMIPQKDRIPEQNMAATWHDPTDLPLNAISQTPNDFVMSAYGDMDSIMNFIPLDQGINGMEGGVFGGLAPLNVDSFRQRLLAAARGDQANREYVERPLNTVSKTRADSTLSFFLDFELIFSVLGNVSILQLAGIQGCF